MAYILQSINKKQNINQNLDVVGGSMMVWGSFTFFRTLTVNSTQFQKLQRKTTLLSVCDQLSCLDHTVKHSSKSMK